MKILFSWVADLLPELLDKTDLLMENLPDICRMADIEAIIGSSYIRRDSGYTLMKNKYFTVGKSANHERNQNTV